MTLGIQSLEAEHSEHSATGGNVLLQVRDWSLKWSNCEGDLYLRGVVPLLVLCDAHPDPRSSHDLDLPQEVERVGRSSCFGVTQSNSSGLPRVTPPHNGIGFKCVFCKERSINVCGRAFRAFGSKGLPLWPVLRRLILRLFDGWKKLVETEWWLSDLAMVESKQSP